MVRRQGGNTRLGVAATARPPRAGEVFATPLDPGFGGIRFEVQRAVEYVREGRKDPLVVDTARYIAYLAADTAKQMGASDEEANSKLTAFEGIHYWCQANFHYVQDPTDIEYMQTANRMIRQKYTPAEILEWIWKPIAEGMANVRGFDISELKLPEGKAIGDCEEAAPVLVCSLCVALDIYPVKFIFGGNDGTLHHVWAGAHTGDGWHESDITQTRFKLDETVPFDHHDELIVPLE